MELKFVETIEGKEWEAEFEAPSDFNLHLERVHGGSLVVSQRGTASGEYASAFAKGMYEGQAVIDYDFGALVYPKYIKVVSGSEVVSASVNFNEGGGSGSGSSDGVKWEYYKIDRSSTSYDYNAMGNVFSYVTLANEKIDGIVYIMPRGQGWNATAAIAGISAKNIAGESVIDTGSWLSNIKECDKLWGYNYDYSFLKPITEEEFYSDNFVYTGGEVS